MPWLLCLFRDEDDGEFLRTKEILDELRYSSVTIEDCIDVRRICKAVSERAAHLASAGMQIKTVYSYTLICEAF